MACANQSGQALALQWDSVFLAMPLIVMVDHGWCVSACFVY